MSENIYYYLLFKSFDVSNIFKSSTVSTESSLLPSLLKEFKYCSSIKGSNLSLENYFYFFSKFISDSII